MRLTEFEKKEIKYAAEKNFGTEIDVYLFGSRIDDSLKGGDIDLLIECDLYGAEVQKRKIKTITDIQLKLGDQKIDIVTISRRNNADKLPYIAEVAKKNGIKL